MARSVVRPGLEVLLSESLHLVQGKRVGLVANPASVTRDLAHAADLLQACPGVRLVALFGPEHGLRGEAQDMEAVPGGTDPGTGLPIHSLYGSSAATLAPETEMLDGLDLLLVDLPDVGARYYTFAATLSHVMERAATRHLPVVVLDRPNPLGGTVVEGPLVEPGFESFVGRFPVPVRHGLTIGELALLFNQEFALGAEVQVVRLQGWTRAMTWEDTGLPWVPPSPNMPTPETAHVYPGGCLVEGTNLSEGRGTTRPFEFVGAPWLEAPALAATLNEQHLPGILFRPHWFRPVAQKWAGRTCAGVQAHVTDRRELRSFAAYVALLAAARRQAPEAFAWRRDAYEFESRHPAIDLLAGSPQLRQDIESDRPVRDMEEEWRRAAAAFEPARQHVLLYDAAP